MAKIKASISERNNIGVGLSSKIGVTLSGKITNNLSKIVNNVFTIEGSIPPGAILAENKRALLTENNKYLIVE
jgi:hypothetical protein